MYSILFPNIYFMCVFLIKMKKTEAPKQYRRIEH